MRKISILTVICTVIAPAWAAGARLNEYNPNPIDDENMTSFIELSGMPGESLDGLFIVTIEGDGSAMGALNNVIDLSGLSIGANGLATIMGSVANLENPSHTLILADGFTGDPGTDPGANDGDDVDLDNDGVLDPMAPMVFGSVLDAIGVADIATDGLYGADYGGTDMTFVPEFDPLPSDEPQLVFRELTTGEWFQSSLDFTLIADASGTLVDGAMFTPMSDTPGAANPAFVPEPTVAGLWCLAVVLLARRKR